MDFKDYSSSLSHLDLPKDTITLSSAPGCTYANTTIASGGYSVSGYGAVPNVTISSGMLGTGTNTSFPYTFSTGAGPVITTPWANGSSSGKLQLNGKEADIEVNGRSLMEAVERIEERLNRLTFNVYV